MSGHDEIRSLLASFALDAVEADDRVVVEEHLEVCPSCRVELADLREDVAAFDRSARPPEGLWAKVAENFRRRSTN